MSEEMKRYTIDIIRENGPVVHGVIEYGKKHAEKLCAKHPNYKMIEVVGEAADGTPDQN